MSQSVKLSTLYFGSGHDRMVREIKPHVGFCADTVGPAWDSLSLAPSLPFPCLHVHILSLSLSLSLKINKL